MTHTTSLRKISKLKLIEYKIGNKAKIPDIGGDEFSKSYSKGIFPIFL